MPVCLQVRHLPRLVDGVSEALQQERLSQADLAHLAPYQPALSAAWLLQRAMALRPGQLAAPAPATPQQPQPQPPLPPLQQQQASGWLPPDHINRLLRCNFVVLRALGRWALRPFLTDTFQALPLGLTMIGMSLV